MHGGNTSVCMCKNENAYMYFLQSHASLSIHPTQVSIPVGTYQPAVSSPNKKAAKAQAALAALQGMGLIGSDGQCIL